MHRAPIVGQNLGLWCTARLPTILGHHRHRSRPGDGLATVNDGRYGKCMEDAPRRTADGSSDGAPGRLATKAKALLQVALRRRIVRALLLFHDRNGSILADAITYRALFSVFAGVLLGFSVAALWLSGNETAWNAIISAVDAALPGLIAQDGKDGIIDPNSIHAPAGLSIAGIISLGGLIWSALGAIRSLRIAMRTMAGTLDDEVASWRVILRNLSLALMIGVAFLGSAALTFAGRSLVRGFAGAIGLPEDSRGVYWAVRVVSLLVVFALNLVLIAAAFRVLSGVRAPARSLWGGAAIGAAALLVLQELSGLFVRGATANPLLASFASLLALLIWLTLSAQVVLVTSAIIVTDAQERTDGGAERSARTVAELRLRRARQDSYASARALRNAQQAVAEERHTPSGH